MTAPWENEKFSKLSTESKLICLFVYAKKHTATPELKQYTGLTEKTIEKAIKELVTGGFVVADGDALRYKGTRTNKKASPQEAISQPIKKPKKKTQSIDPKTESLIEKFWGVYPKKENKEDFQAFFRALKADIAEKERIVAAAERYAAQCLTRGTEPRYISTPINFIRRLKYVEFLDGAPVYKSESIVDNILGWEGTASG